MPGYELVGKEKRGAVLEVFDRCLQNLHRVLARIYHAPLSLICFAICKLPSLSHYKKHLLSTWADVKKRKGIDNFLFNRFFSIWIKFEYLKERNPDKRENLKELSMGGSSGKEWAKYYNTNPISSDFNTKRGHLSFREAAPLFDEIEGILKNSKTDLLIIQIGSSSGREIAYFAAKYPGHTYIGTDTYQEIIDYSALSHKFENLSFKKISAKDISQLLSEYKDRNMILFSSCSLEYVQPEHLETFFDSIAKYPVRIILTETANESDGSPDKLRGSRWRGNFSYTHDYKFYAEKAGIRTIKHEIVRPYFPYKDFPGRKNVVHYFYSGICIGSNVEYKNIKI